MDTNIVSFLLKTPNPSLRHRYARTPPEACAISTVVESELRYGALLLPPTARIHLALATFLSGITILPWDSACAVRCAELRAHLEPIGETMGLADTMIAAHALALGLTLVSNDKAFPRVPNLKLEDWMKGPQPA